MLLKITEDGSHTLFSEKIEECYHSQHGAIQESEHIFIKAGMDSCSKPAIKILEIGFGTGLNALLTLLNAERYNKNISYTAIEYYPVKKYITERLNYPEIKGSLRKADFDKIHDSSWNKKEKIKSFFTLEKIEADFTRIQLPDSYDLIYFDAFSPDKQPEMWQQERFEMLYNHANDDCILTTYCSKGIVRRAMQNAGFTVERLPGPPGKREILRAIKEKNA